MPWVGVVPRATQVQAGCQPEPSLKSSPAHDLLPTLALVPPLWGEGLVLPVMPQRGMPQTEVLILGC